MMKAVSHFCDLVGIKVSVMNASEPLPILELYMEYIGVIYGEQIGQVEKFQISMHVLVSLSPYWSYPGPAHKGKILAQRSNNILTQYCREI